MTVKNKNNNQKKNNKAVTLKEIFKGYSGNYRPVETNWGKDKGKEDYVKL